MSPHDFNDSQESLDFGFTLLTFGFQLIKLPPINKSTSPFISNNHIGTCPSSKLFSNSNCSNFSMCCIDVGIVPFSLLLLNAKYVMLGRLPISKGISIAKLLFIMSSVSKDLSLTMEVGISSTKLLPRTNNFYYIFRSPISSRSFSIRELLSNFSTLKFARNLTYEVKAPPSKLLLMSRY
ncbi:unnamed protein product [Citrullus colocynthis]|uniref:Uncharacterized protein n=1 Tax=Citrullus colocynthis TaxID=252529 RepID=A0ABP0Z877_9ROSI